jgi:hypothetical protein
MKGLGIFVCLVVWALIAIPLLNSASVGPALMLPLEYAVTALTWIGPLGLLVGMLVLATAAGRR